MHKKKGGKTVQDNEVQETISKTIRFEKDLVNKIDELRKDTERNFSQQVKFMIKRYIEIIERNDK